MIRISNLRFELTDEINTYLIAKKLGISETDIINWHFNRKSVDARRKKDIFYSCTIDVEVKHPEKLKKIGTEISEKRYEFPKNIELKSRPLIIGSGPAGLFAALMLAENGHRPILIERGEAVEDRMKSVKDFHEKRVLKPDSNVQFGEGGAGTFSDGKLTTGIKNIRCRTVLEYFVKFGADEDILYNAKPHIGTDVLCRVVENMRKYIISCGGEVHFNTKAEKFIIENGKISGVVADGREFRADGVILATGHSARDTVRELFSCGANMSAKAFSVGARIEHLQSAVNATQYGESAKYLDAADYKLSIHLDSGRGVYTFCMCPGGVVVGAASEEGGVVTNGMSYHSRDGKNANSALLVGVNPDDFASDHPLAGLDFQERIEKKAFEVGGCDYSAPAQTVGDFLKNIPSDGMGNVEPTYSPGVKWGKIDEVLPDFVTKAMREAIPLLDRKLNGFGDKGAVLTVPETRSSSPVRILRDDSMQSNIRGLYPCGEGAGYAGGIMSAAVDGIACAEQLVLNEKMKGRE